MTPKACVIGAGPAGLMAADVMSDAGLAVTVFDQMPSVGRKFLMAGKSGLNLTKAEPDDQFSSNVTCGPAIRAALADFGPDGVVSFANGLGQDVFTGSTGRVFPNVMKASPLLRAWLARMQGRGVRLRTRHKWVGGLGTAPRFQVPHGIVEYPCDVVVFALGGGSWARLGSDGAWRTAFDQAGIMSHAFKPSNIGYLVPWSDKMTPHFGKPIKSVTLRSGGVTSQGEFVLSRSGIEGGGVYQLGSAPQDTGQIELDLIPHLTTDQATQKLAAVPKKQSLSNRLRKAFKFPQEKIAMVQELGRPLPAQDPDLCALLKQLTLPVQGTPPLDQAISTRGGVAATSLSDDFMLTTVPGVFCAGEMLDWDAPTGGYLLTTCFATGRAAGLAASRYALSKVRT